jgi:hypothetical protein
MKKGGGLYLEGGAQTFTEAEFEERVNAVADKIIAEAAHRRRILTLEELMDMTDITPQFEEHFPQVGAWFFSINGTLHGERVSRAMLAGNCALVFAETREQAHAIAEAGFADTRIFANDYAFKQYLGIDPFEEPSNAGVVTERKVGDDLLTERLGALRKPH